MKPMSLQKWRIAESRLLGIHEFVRARERYPPALPERLDPQP